MVPAADGPDNHWRRDVGVVAFSIVAVGTLYVGSALGELLAYRVVRETVETIPVLLCLALVLRYTPPAQAMSLHWALRTLFLAAPFVGITLSDVSLEASPDVWILGIAAWEATMIGVSEELIFRFSLQRLWAKFGHVFFIAASSLLFGALHLEDGLAVAVVSCLLGLTFALARVAGMPIIVLILVHGFYDYPAMIERHLAFQ